MVLLNIFIIQKVIKQNWNVKVPLEKDGVSQSMLTVPLQTIFTYLFSNLVDLNFF